MLYCQPQIREAEILSGMEMMREVEVSGYLRRHLLSPFAPDFRRPGRNSLKQYPDDDCSYSKE